MRQIIRILLDNALTHTPEGTKVTVTTYSANRRAELTVSDEGSGHPAAGPEPDLRALLHRPTRPAAPGSGWRSRSELAQRMDGRITISSSRRFTAFTLDLPPARDATAARAGRRPRQGAGA